MPKRLLTPEVMAEVVHMANINVLEKLKITKYASGKNKGRLYADYTEGDRELRQADLQVLTHFSELLAQHPEPGVVAIEATLQPDENLLYELKETVIHEN